MTRTFFYTTLMMTFATFAACGGTNPRERDTPRERPSIGLDEEACRGEVKYQCAYECIETSKSPADRNGCEVKCQKRPISDWNGKIPACTP